MKTIIKEWSGLSGACPTQAEGVTDDDRAVYVRYRWGGLSVRVSEPGDHSEFSAVRGEEIFQADIGDGFDGFLSEGQLRAATAEVIEWPAPVSGTEGGTL